MILNDIKKDIKFRQKCGLYGVNWNCAEVIDDVILLNTDTLGLYVLMDKNYNTFCVDVCDFSKYLDKVDFAKRKYYEYIEGTDGFNFCYPFNSFTLKNIFDLSNCVYIMEDRDENVLTTIVKGRMYDRATFGYDEYFQMLSYIKFISEEVKRYFLISFHMKSIGADMIDVYEYINLLVSRINECIEFNIHNNDRPNMFSISSFLGQNYRGLKMCGILGDIINLLIREKGYSINNDYDIEIMKIDDKIDLSLINEDLLKILGNATMDNVLECRNNINIKKLIK